MDGLQPIEARVRRAKRVEPFVRLIVGGGMALVAGLWIAMLTSALSVLWLAGITLVLLGVGGLAYGIHYEITSRP